MAMTGIPAGSPLAVRKYSNALFAMVGMQSTPTKYLTGSAPTIDDADKVLRKQTTNDMPFVKVRDLAQSAGDTVRVDLANIVKLRPVMGDENAEGTGAKLDFSFKDISINMATLGVSAGGKMTQKRMQHDLAKIAIAQLGGSIPNFLWQRQLVQACGARGDQDNIHWILPLETDPEFAAMMVNPVRAPTYNRHYVVDGTDLIQGGQQLASVDSTDALLLDHIDRLAALVDEANIRMQPIKIPGDPAAGDDPILGVLMLDNLVWDRLITDKTSGGNIRTWQAAAADRASYSGMGKHPLFSGSPFLWRNILVRRMGQFAVRFNGGGNVKHISAANRYTATETNVTLPALSGHQVSRSVFLGAQALALCEGANTDSGRPYTLLQTTTNVGRNLEMFGEVIGGDEKLRFDLPDGLGNKEPTDIGALVIDSVTRRVAA